MQADKSATGPMERSSVASTGRSSRGSLEATLDIMTLEGWTPATFVYKDLVCDGKTRLEGVETLWRKLSKLVRGRADYISRDLKVCRKLTRSDVYLLTTNECRSLFKRTTPTTSSTTCSRGWATIDRITMCSRLPFPSISSSRFTGYPGRRCLRAICQSLSWFAT